MENDNRVLGLAPMERIMRSVGAERVSNGARMELKAFLEKIGERVATDAVRFAIHAGRKTVKDMDIRLAIKNYE